MDRSTLASLAIDCRAFVQQAVARFPQSLGQYTSGGDALAADDLEHRLDEAVQSLDDDERSWGEDDRYTLAEVEAATCAWEYVLNQVRGPDIGPWDEFTSTRGMAQARSEIMALGKRIDADYERAKADETSRYHVENQCFDWDYVPEWMETHRGEITT